MNKIKSFIKNLNVKAVIKVGAFALGFVLVIVTAMVDCGLDPSKLDVYKWITNSLISTGIMVYGLLIGESIGKDNSTRHIEKDKDGNIVGGIYQKNLYEYNKLYKELEPLIIYFNQFYYWFLRKELRRKKIDYLKDNDVDYEWCELILDYVNLSNVYQLSQEEGFKFNDKDGNEQIIPQQTESQLEAIKNVLNGVIKIKQQSPSYYLNPFENVKAKSTLEEPLQIDKDIIFNKHSNRIFKIVLSLFISIIWAMFTVNDFMGGGDPQAKSQAWMNLVSRITALVTSFVSGWASAIIDTKLRAKKIKGKYNVLSMFKSAIDLREFTPESKKAEAKKRWEEVMAKRQAAIDNVIDPEIITQQEKPLQIEELCAMVTPIVEIKKE